MSLGTVVKCPGTYVQYGFDIFKRSVNNEFNLGQGVIVKRPAYSDFIFANAMRSKNYISAECKSITTHFKRIYISTLVTLVLIH